MENTYQLLINAARRALAVLICCLATAGLAQAQDFWPIEEEIELTTDRPDNTNSPAVVPRGLVQLETGVLFRQDVAEGERQTELLYPRFLVRLGVLRNVELQLEGDHRREQVQPENRQRPPVTTQGFNAFALGTKIRLLKGDGLLPDLGVVARVTLPFGGNAWVPQQVAPQIRLAMSHEVTDKLQIQYNLGWERDWEDGEFEEKLVYTLAASQELSNRLTVFAEVVGDRAFGDTFSHSLDGGLLFRLTPLFQVDVWGGFGLSRDAPDFFVGTGLAFRLPR